MRYNEQAENMSEQARAYRRLEVWARGARLANLAAMYAARAARLEGATR